MFDTKKVILILEASRQPYLSICQLTGAVQVNGTVYLYNREQDILVREDWAKFYKALPYEDFLNAVRTGKKPQLPKKNKTPKQQEKGLLCIVPAK